ncbi:VOC family protein [Tumebacillus flagellatus]|uniref:Glyoxalase/fosfomycin resistance/dioxygenase domain-containing protein n=1 Tax=Tumebacillus flagellatus TaxID=1157490 RepID=A0A074LT99_9BACL|nr:VOC family protein [Tumebacillus flagellatus]KEO84239.1 hypothetical protein EL26_05595 [Tumebacillus flagellatus]
MKFRHVTFFTNVVREMQEFYTNVLQMPLEAESETRFTVRAGATLVTFEETVDDVPFYHFAFALNTEFFEEMKARVTERTPLLGKNGYTLFQSQIWHTSEQIYFDDPQRNVVEILGLPQKTEVSSDKWIRLLEVGRPVRNVTEFVASEEAQAWPTIFRAESDTFSFYGDTSGVFVVVQEGRPWFPTDRPATVHGLKLEIEK